MDRSKVQGQWTGQKTTFGRSEERKVTEASDRGPRLQSREPPSAPAAAVQDRPARSNPGALASGPRVDDAGEHDCCPVQGWLLLNHPHSRLRGHKQGHRDQFLLHDFFCQATIKNVYVHARVCVKEWVAAVELALSNLELNVH